MDSQSNQDQQDRHAAQEKKQAENQKIKQAPAAGKTEALDQFETNRRLFFGK